MQIIKFRAWDKADKVMYYNVQNGIWFNDDSHYGFEKFLGYLVGEEDYHEWVLMQFTGLFDKNGVEIYKGDIVNVDGYIGEVFYDDYCWSVKNDTDYFFMSHYDNPYDPFSEGIIEVIGNKYEGLSPEYLKDALKP